MKFSVSLSLCRGSQRKQQTLIVHMKLDFKNFAVGYTTKDVCYAAFKLTVLLKKKKQAKSEKIECKSDTPLL